MILNDKLLDEVTALAQVSGRLWMNCIACLNRWMPKRSSYSMRWRLARFCRSSVISIQPKLTFCCADVLM